MSYLSGHPARPPNTNVQHVQHYVRLFTEADASLSLTIRDGKVTLAPSDPSDPYQQWEKDERFAEVKDGSGLPSFALVNKATGQAIKNSVGAGEPVQLTTYVPDIFDKSVHWTLGDDHGDGYRAMRKLSDTSLNLDALIDNSHGVVHDGIIIGLFEWNHGGNQRWKIVPYEYVPTVRVFTKANTNCSLAIRHGKVILAQADPSDLSQHWVKNEKDTTLVKDKGGFPGFALVNKATGQGMKHSVGAAHEPVELIPYVPGTQNLNESFLWTLGVDLGDGYRAMRMLTNPSLNVDAFVGNEGVHDGTIIGLWEWKGGDNQRWKIVAY